jgi:hypothetical protein
VTTISSSQLAGIIQEPLSKLAVWQTRGHVKAGRHWDFREALTIGLFAEMMKSNRSAADASALAKGAGQVLGQFLNAAHAETTPADWADIDTLLAVVATLPEGGEELAHVRHRSDLKELVDELVFERHATRIEVIDLFALFARASAAFAAERAKAPA